MKDFVLKDVSLNLEQELENIGFDKSYIFKAVEKFKYKNIKIFDLTIPQANILKQTAISVGADCAVHRETITAKVEKTDCILGGSFSQLRKISDKLKKQPFGLADLAIIIEKNLNFKLMPIVLKNKSFDFSKPYIVGILNITQNSFSDGGDYFEEDSAKKHLLQLIEDGADIIDIGAESTKPFSSPVSDEIQLEKLLPILNFIKEKEIQTPISIDTRSSKVAEACIKAGADIINDVSGGDYDENMLNIVAKYNVPIILQHSKGTPENMQINPSYDNLIEDIFKSLYLKIKLAKEKGVQENNIIVDVGIGFGKTREQNIEIIKRIDELVSLGCPIMIGTSRKSFLNLKDAENDEKDIYTLAVDALLLNSKINFLRVHNVKLHNKFFEIISL